MKKNLDMFCLSLNPEHVNLIKKLNYIPVGLGKLPFGKDWLTDKGKKNISNKNDFYGEYTFIINYGKMMKLLQIIGQGFVNIESSG